MNRCTRCTPSIRPFLSVSTRGRNSSRHPPPPNLHIHRNVPRKGEEHERFRLRVSTGFPRTRHPISAVFRADLPLGSRSPLRRGSTRSPLSVTCRDSSDYMLVVWSSNDRVHASDLVLCVPSREGTHLSLTLASVFLVGVLRVLRSLLRSRITPFHWPAWPVVSALL